MKLLVIAKCCYLLLTILHGCDGDDFDKCTAPTFKDTLCRPTCCHEYSAGLVYVGNTVSLTVKPVLEANLTITWQTKNLNPIVGNDGEYLLKDNNRTLEWESATKGRTVFFINATNSCGKSTKACYVVRPVCNKCLSCPRVDKVINDTRNVFEHGDLRVTASMVSDSTSGYLQWCFIGSNNQRNCCICDNKAGGNFRNCSQEDWHLQTTYGEECSYKITCTLTVKNTANKYNGGVLIGEAIATLQSKTILASQINVTVVHKDHRNYLFYIISGCGALIVVIIIMIIGHHIVNVAKARRKTSTRNYLSINSSLSHSYPVRATQEDVDSDTVSVDTNDFGEEHSVTVSVHTNDFGEESSQPNLGTQPI